MKSENIEKFERYYQMMIEANQKMNLTRILDRDDAWLRHFEDSLSIVRAVPDLENNEYKIIDVGTGAGLPGLVLAIEYPNLRLTLTDSVRKKLVFVDSVVRELSLKNVITIHGRAEFLAREPKLRESFDLAVSRGVAKLSTLCELCTPFIHSGGKLIAYKGPRAQEEIADAKTALNELMLEISGVTTLYLEENDNERNLISVVKKSPTPKKYPRKPDLPRTEPL